MRRSTSATRYLQAGKYDKAVEAVRPGDPQLPDRRPRARRVLQEGTALRDLKQVERAREAFEFVVKTYPDSDAAQPGQAAARSQKSTLTLRRPPDAANRSALHAADDDVECRHSAIVCTVTHAIEGTYGQREQSDSGRQSRTRRRAALSRRAARPSRRFSIATTEVWNDKAGQKQEKTEWHRIVLWGKPAESLHRYLTKGKQIYVEGRLQTRQWDDKDGKKRYTHRRSAATAIVLLGGGGGGGGGASMDRGGDSGGSVGTRADRQSR